MSDEATKVKHSKRRHNTNSVIESRRKTLKQMEIITGDYSKCRNKLNKMNGINCGNPGCMMCMNPRRYGEKTIQELSFEQTEKWSEE